VALRPGDDNLEYQRKNYEATVGIALGQSDYNRLWHNFDVTAGNDVVPMGTSLG
jgi:hypothetical protein